MNEKIFMMTKKGIVLLLTLTSVKSFACNPNRNCMQAGPDYPCGTWSEPFRMCPSQIENPFCLTERLACKAKLATCVSSVLVGTSAGALCGPCIVSIWGTAGASAAACVPACGLTAVAIEQAVQQCEE